MNIRDAILKAADHIERHPGDFDFGSAMVPHTCGSPGCALGWLGHFIGGCTTYRHVCDRVFGIDEYKFYERLTEAEMGPKPDWSYGTWHRDAGVCARVLRLYADKYHPAERYELIPESVRNIFTMTTEQLRAEFERI
jgi:hypothetical protein